MRAALALVVLALAGCGAVTLGSGGVESDILAYEKTLRLEADWLWNSMNYARTHYLRDDALCVDPDFGHEPVPLTDLLRHSDPHSASLIEHLDYAAARIVESRAAWAAWCAGSGPGPSTYMEAHLRPAYESLNLIRRELTAQQTAPQPGSG